MGQRRGVLVGLGRGGLHDHGRGGSGSGLRALGVILKEIDREGINLLLRQRATVRRGKRRHHGAGLAFRRLGTGADQ